jgi:predicted dehydrogenase
MTTSILKSGKPVLLEKPMASNLEEATDSKTNA